MAFFDPMAPCLPKGVAYDYDARRYRYTDGTTISHEELMDRDAALLPYFEQQRMTDWLLQKQKQMLQYQQSIPRDVMTMEEIVKHRTNKEDDSVHTNNLRKCFWENYFNKENT